MGGGRGGEGLPEWGWGRGGRCSGAEPERMCRCLVARERESSGGMVANAAPSRGQRTEPGFSSVNQDTQTKMKGGVPGLNVGEGNSISNPIKKDFVSKALRDLITSKFLI